MLKPPAPDSKKSIQKSGNALKGPEGSSHPSDELRRVLVLGEAKKGGDKGSSTKTENYPPTPKKKERAPVLEGRTSQVPRRSLSQRSGGSQLRSPTKCRPITRKSYCRSPNFRVRQCQETVAWKRPQLPEPACIH